MEHPGHRYSSYVNQQVGLRFLPGDCAYYSGRQMDGLGLFQTLLTHQAGNLLPGPSPQYGTAQVGQCLAPGLGDQTAEHWEETQEVVVVEDSDNRIEGSSEV